MLSWKSAIITIVCMFLLLGSSLFVAGQVMKVAGLAVAQGKKRTEVCDMAVGDGLGACVMAVMTYGWNGTAADRIRGDSSRGLDMNMTGFASTTTNVSADGITNPTTALPSAGFNLLYDGTDSNLARDATAYGDTGITPTGVGIVELVAESLGSGAKVGGSGRSLFTLPTSANNNNNTHQVSAANTATTFTITATASLTNVIHKVSAFCSAGTATLQILTPPGTVEWESAPGEVGTTTFTIDFNPGIILGEENTAVDVTLGACGAANTGTLMVHAAKADVS